MAQPPNIDGILITWGDRLFYPGNRVVKVKPQPKLSGDAARLRAVAIRKRIEATVVRRAPQVMVKVTGGGRGMKAIAAHFRYISKNGRLEIEDQRGETMRGKDTLIDLADEWRFGGSVIPDDAEPGHRREAFNIMLSMPHGTDPLSVCWRRCKSASIRWRGGGFAATLAAMKCRWPREGPSACGGRLRIRGQNGSSGSNSGGGPSGTSWSRQACWACEP